MASLSLDALALAGFTLAHAVWSVSDTEADELLTPLALLELAGQRRLVRFEADTQEAAIARGEAAMREAYDEADAWAFAREGVWRPGGTQDARDVVVVEFWAEGMDAPAAVVQPFERSAPGRPFRLTEPPTLALQGQVVDQTEAESALRVLERGFHSHYVAAKYWPTEHPGQSGPP